MNSDIWQFKNNICRCCHAEGLFFNLAEPRSFHGEMEVYVDMIKDVFNIKMRPIPGAMCESTYTICMPCIIKLREAIQFKNQVQSCEDRFIDLCLNNKLKVLVFKKTDTAKVNEEHNKDVKEEYLVLENVHDRNNDADPDFDANDEEMEREDDVVISTESEERREEVKHEETEAVRNLTKEAEKENFPEKEEEMEREDDVVISTESEERREEVKHEETEAVRNLTKEAEKEKVPEKEEDVKEERLALENDIDKNNDADPPNANEQEMEREDDVVISTESEERREEVKHEEIEAVRNLTKEAEKEKVPEKEEDVKEERLALENDIDKNNDADPPNANEQEMESEDDVEKSTESEKVKGMKPEETEAVSVRTSIQEAENKNVPIKKKVGRSTKFRLQPGDYEKTGDIYKCSKCDKEYNKIVSLRFHVKSKHYRIPRFVCELCKKEFMTIAPFTIHKFEEHNIDDRFKCNACKAMFNSKIQLRNHTNNFHMLGEKYKHKAVKDRQEEKANNDTLKPRLRNLICNDQSKNDFSSPHLNKETSRLSDEPIGHAAQIPLAVSRDILIRTSESKDLDVPNKENTEDIDIPPPPEKTTTKRGKRSWNRRNCCFYCEKLVTNYTRHLFRRHSKEPEVLRIKAIKDPDPIIQRKKRQVITDDMRNHGNYLHNSKVVSNKEGQLLPARRTNNEPNKPESATTFVVCKNCFGTYKRASFFRHSKKCGGDDAETNRYLARNSMRIIPDLKNAPQELIKNRLTRFNNDDISRIAKNDPLNGSFGCRILRKKKERNSRKSRCS